MAAIPSDLIEQRRSFGMPGWPTLLLVAILTVANLVPIWVVSRFPSQNGPWYLLQVQMFREFDNPTWDYSDYYRISWHPTPHMLHNVLVLSLSYVFPLFTAEKVALSIHAILIPLSIFYFLRVVAPNRMVVGFLSFLMVNTLAFYKGYHNFSLSVPFFFFAFAYWHGHRDRVGVRQAVVMALLACLTFLAHIVAFAFLAATIGYYRLLETRNVRKTVLATLLATWPGWLLALDHSLLVNHSANWINPPDTSFLKLHTSLENLARDMFYSTSFPAYVAATLTWVWAACLFLVRLVRLKGEGQGFVRAFFRDPLLVVLATIAVCYFSMPYKLLGWHYVNIRMIPFILGLGLACVTPFSELKRGVPLRYAFLASVCIAVLVVSACSSLEVIRMARDVDEYLSGIEHFEGNVPLLPIHVENDAFGRVRPITRCHEYYHIAKGGANSHGVAECANTIVCVWYRQYPAKGFLPRFNPDEPHESMRRIQEIYGYVLVWGNDGEWEERLAAHGFALVHHQGRLRLYRNQAPPVHIARAAPRTGRAARLPAFLGSH